MTEIALYFLEDTATPILQTNATDYGIGGYIFMVTNGMVRVVRFFSKALIGAQLNWSVWEKEFYGIFYGVQLFKDLQAIHFEDRSQEPDVSQRHTDRKDPTMETLSPR
jgi:hypothetical protein